MKGAAVMVAPSFKRKNDESIKNKIIYLEVSLLFNHYNYYLLTSFLLMTDYGTSKVVYTAHDIRLLFKTYQPNNRTDDYCNAELILA